MNMLDIRMTRSTLSAIVLAHSPPRIAVAPSTDTRLVALIIERPLSDANGTSETITAWLAAKAMDVLRAIVQKCGIRSRSVTPMGEGAG